MLQSPALLEVGLHGGRCRNQRSLPPELVFTIPLAPSLARWPQGEPDQAKVLAEK